MDATFASQEFESLKAAEGDEFKVEGAGAIGRADDNVDVLDCGDARTDTSTGGWIGGGIDLVVGLLASPLLVSTAMGRGPP